MADREQKIKMIIGLLNGTGVIGSSRGKKVFNLVSPGKYKVDDDDKVYSLEDIEVLNRPYASLNGGINWVETKNYKDRSVTNLGLCPMLQINITPLNQAEPNKVILPAIELNY